MNKVSGIVTKIVSPLDKYGELIGAGAAAYVKRNHLMVEAQRIAQGHIHFPDIKKLTDNLSNEPLFQQGVAAIIGGFVLKEAGIHPVLSRIGSAAQKIGTGMALTVAVENTLGYSTNPGYPEQYGSGSGSSGTTAAGYSY